MCLVVPSEDDSISTGASAGPVISTSMGQPCESMTGIRVFLRDFCLKGVTANSAHSREGGNPDSLALGPRLRGDERE